MILVVDVSPTARRREVGTILRAHRQRLGLTAVDVSASTGMSPAKLSRLERGERGIQLADVKRLCLLYLLDADETNRISMLARASRQAGWWSEYAALDDVAPMFFGLEASATAIEAFQSLRVPGLLQTGEYARALLARLRPPEVVTEEWVATRVESRLHRQRLLEMDDGRSFTYVCDESMFRRQVGSASVMAEQVAKIRRVAERRNVEIRVIPFAAGSHPGLDGSFTLMRLYNLPDTVFVEGLAGSWFIDDNSRVSVYSSVFKELAAMSMPEVESMDWLDAVERDWRGHVEVGDSGSENG